MTQSVGKRHLTWVVLLSIRYYVAVVGPLTSGRVILSSEKMRMDVSNSTLGDLSGSGLDGLFRT